MSGEDVFDAKTRIIEAGKVAVDELIKVAEEKIVTGGDDDVSVDRLKNAAATKKLAIFDAFEILSRIERERIDMNPSETVSSDVVEEQKPKSISGFAEKRSK